MKRIRYILPLFLAFACILDSCVDPLEMQPDGTKSLSSNSLAISPSVLGIDVATKAEGVDALGENVINTLDVYVYTKTVSGEEISLTFFKRYHFTKSELTPLTSGTDIFLENWRNEPVAKRYTPGTKYRVYAIANSRQTSANREKDLTWEELMNLNFTSPQTVEFDGKKYAYDIVRLKGSAPANEQDTHIAAKDFVMDGMVDDWEIADSSEPQYITEYKTAGQAKYHHFELKRAAAKFHVTLTFGNFINNQPDPDDPTNTNRRVVTKLSNPSFKFANFMTSSYEVTPVGVYPNATFRDAHLWDSENRYIFNSQTNVGEPNPEQRYKYELTTYSYAYNWANKEEGAEVSPSLLFSVGYSSYIQAREDSESAWATVEGSETATEYHYYRIPLIDLSTGRLAVDRNTYYDVTAQINSKGAKTVDTEEPTDVFLMYKVIPWPAKPNEVTDANTTQLQYFVAEKTYRLRGDGLQPADLQYFTPKSDKVNGHFQAEPKIMKVRVYYVNQSGTQVEFDDIWEANKVSGTEDYVWSDGIYSWTGSSSGVTITVVPNPDGVGGNFHITSTSLLSRAVKYITFTAVVDYDFDNGPQLKQDIVVTHFPLDNIQSLQGYWSTKNAEIEISSTGGNGWITRQGNNEYINYSTYNSNQNNINYFRVELSSNEPYITFNGYSWNWLYQRGYYRTEATAYETDYYEPYIYRFWFDGSKYYLAYYYRYNESLIRYFRLTPSNAWVNWDDHTGTKWNDNNFTAKFWGPYYSSYGGNDYVYNMTSNNSGTGANNEGNRLKNNHIYIIQISKAEEGVILGRPKIENYQSQDNVVSPAFMIASQLGAVSTFKENNSPGLEAAMHCASYVEVTRYSQNGTLVSRRFEGWRLPTAAEIDYIIRYQGESAAVQAGVFQDVLTGGHYYTLDGGAAATHYTTDESYAVRCIRDLTPAEVVELNNSSKITNASL